MKPRNFMLGSGPEPLTTRKLRDLDLTPGGPGSSTHLYGASGLVASGGKLYVVADDELCLACFPQSGDAPGTRLPLVTGALPQGAAARKHEKADFEILLRLPPLPGYPHGALLALGSGSTPRRQRGAMLALEQAGRVSDEAVEVDARPLYCALAAELGVLNLEGGWQHAGQLHLLQRGNQGSDGNAVIDLPFAAIAATLAQEHYLPYLPPTRVTRLPLGAIDGVRLAFTDACGLPDGSWLYSAVAEDTTDAYADGDFIGAVVGHVNAGATPTWQRRVEPAGKVEGIFAESTAAGSRVLLVTDADDRSRPAQLLETHC